MKTILRCLRAKVASSLLPRRVACQGVQVQQEHGRQEVLAQRMRGVPVDRQVQVLVGRQQVQVHRWALHRLGWALGQRREEARVQVAENDKLVG